MNLEWIQHENSLTLVDKGEHSALVVERFLRHLFQTSRFYRRQIEETGVPLDAPFELLSRMPVSSKEDYRDALQTEALQTLHARPFISDYSSGSTDKCVLRFSSVAEELAELEITETVFRRAGMGAGDRFVCLEVGAPEIYDFYFRAARNIGAAQTTYIKVTSHYAASFAPLLRLEPTVILSLPSLMVKAWPYIRDHWPKGASPVKSFIHMGEAMHPDLKREIETVWGCKVYSFYGTTELGGMGGECIHGNGCHFDPRMVCPTLGNPSELSPGLFEGEGYFTTLHFRSQAVVKYRAGDVVQLDLNPCPCGEDSPRLRFVERTADSFIITGDKFRYETVFNALRKAVPEIDLLTIRLDDIPGSDKARITLVLPKAAESRRERIAETLRRGIFELDAVFHYGFAEFELEFVSPEAFGERKMKRVVDARKYFS
ncbi:Phenylacetate-coenzyme A ligase [Pontiella desulfatans]|uniref:Phenylacetate-coenzyme A ligase n=1 Tax=Pontiella desulfatans TaxID=2750659 RepID=A0A6C2UB15_PONDE|nr:phenylacetate--CoA ligase family protein [Pontiella desulfatans]VGO16496.1 Phenylacetate-coenzyme A ligase [Pontiella desulfatans]